MKLKKFYVLQRRFYTQDIKTQFNLTSFNAKNQDIAWKKAEKSISENSSQEWLLTKEELSAVRRLLNKVR